MAAINPFENTDNPSDDNRGGCGPWCAPLHLIERAIDDQAFARYFDCADFMFMGTHRRGSRPTLYLYKHGYTRRYLNVDSNGHAYRFLPPRRADSPRLGQYRAHRDLLDAIEHLRLCELPNLKDDVLSERVIQQWHE